LQTSGLASVVHKTRKSTNNTVSEGGSASEDLANVVASECVHVPVVRVVLDGFDSLDFTLHLIVAFFEVVVVSVSVRMTAHDLIIIEPL
jgi:hypothetical protein